MNGVLVMDKPPDFTSFDVVAVMRRVSHQRKIGHTGTLDPMATGVLPLLLGNATRAASLMDDSGKEYEASFRFGQETDTQDSTGKVTAQTNKKVSKQELTANLSAFRGEIWQTPPMYSAVQKDGKRLYALARQGITVERERRPVTIYKLELLEFDEVKQSGRLAVSCSKGTYIRTICADLAEAVGTYGVMTALSRTRAAGFSLQDTITLEQAKNLSPEELQERVLPVERLFFARPILTVSQAQAVRFRNGGALDLKRTDFAGKAFGGGESCRVHAPDGEFLGLGEIQVETNELLVLKLFCQA